MSEISKPQKKRGRKSKSAITNETQQENVVVETPQEATDGKQGPKKRGRKPRGGKIIVPPPPSNTDADLKMNIILHLKCSLKDLEYNTSVDMEPYSNEYSDTYENVTLNKHANFTDNYVINNDTIDTSSKEYERNPDADSGTRGFWTKIKDLEHRLHHNHASEQHSACFWCTYPFDNPPFYIPKNLLKDIYNVYGCFCSPECAAAHLMKEQIDSSVKFESYSLLNSLYGSIYKYTRNIKPAPDPYYMLDKYYGNLSIQEYRSLLSDDRLFMIVDKPLTKIMPELHQATDDHIINHKIIPNNQGLKRNVKKTVTKSDILAENFGFNT